jgi:LCP family protein required for cell wall assembly
VDYTFNRRAHWLRAVSSFCMVLLVSGALYCGLFFFSTVRAIFARTTLPFVDNVAKAQIVQGHGSNSRAQELPDLVQRKERVNILLLGIDQRPQENGFYRTDTMILVSIDPATRSAAMLSIPRDLWVTIPGYGENRINTAHSTGDAKGYPGGGVALAKKTVWYCLGIPVHYYVRINFTGFEKLIDAIGGITIDVKKPIHDEKYPDDNYGTMVIDIPAGVQHMDGKTALQYARSRHGNSDYDRMKRQQEVLLAARDKVLRLDIPLSRVPELLKIAGDSIQTDLSLDEIIALARIAKEIDPSQIKTGLIDSSMTTSVKTPQGWIVEVPDWQKVRKLVDELFPTQAPSTVVATSLTRVQLDAEAARIELRNGTLDPTLAQRTAQRLRDKGFNVVRYEDADRFDYDETIIIYYADKPHTVEGLVSELGAKLTNARPETKGPSDLDIVVILGREYLQKASS